MDEDIESGKQPPDVGEDTSSPPDQNESDADKGRSRRQFLKNVAGIGAGIAAGGLLASGQPAAAQHPVAAGAPPIAPAPGGASGWQSGVGIYGGGVNLSTGNATLSLPICGGAARAADCRSVWCSTASLPAPVRWGRSGRTVTAWPSWEPIPSL